MKVTIKRTSILIAALVILAVFVAVGLSGNQAGAFSGSAGFVSSCQACHTQTAVHDFHWANVTNTCADCHTAGTGTPPAPSACAACHGAGAILASPTHVADPQNCSSTAGCHGVAATTTTTVPPVTTTSTTVAPTTTSTTVAPTTTSTTVAPTTTSTTVAPTTTSTTVAPTTTSTTVAPTTTSTTVAPTTTSTTVAPTTTSTTVAPTTTTTEPPAAAAAQVTVQVLDEAGNTINDAKVVLQKRGSDEHEVYTDSIGVARFSNIPYGTYMLVVSRDKYSRYSDTLVVDSPTVQTTVRILVQEDEHEDDHEEDGDDYHKVSDDRYYYWWSDRHIER